MGIMEQFNSELNKAKRASFLAWEAYREKQINQMKDYIPKESKCLVLGAGNCQDIPLSFLTKGFESIVLTDINENAMRNGVRDHKLSASSQKKIKYSSFEYTGFENSLFFEDLFEKIRTITSFSEIKTFIDAKLKKIEAYKWNTILNHTFDFIYITPLYTQLIYQQTLSICKIFRIQGIEPKFVDYIERYMLEKMPFIIDCFNQNVLSLLNPNGMIYVCSDIFEGSKENNFIKNIISHIENVHEVEQIYQNYQKEYGYGLGDYGLFSLQDQNKTQDMHWMMWPFSNEKVFIVKSLVIQKG